MKEWITLFTLLVIGGFAVYYDVTFLSHPNPFESVLGKISAIDKTKEINLQQINNVGYTLYLGQIDSPNAVFIDDTLKEEMTRTAYNSRFPKSILAKIPIVFVNSLALKSGQYIATPWGNMNVMDFGSGFLYEGGVYVTYESGGAIIYLNKEILAKGSLNDVLTHELGHAIGSTLTDAEWTKYYQLREIASGTPRYGSNWNLSPAEDFAEVYKNTFTGLDVKTYFGLLVANNLGMFEVACKKIHDDLYNSYIPQRVVNMSDPLWIFKSTTSTTTIDTQAIESKITNDPKLQSCRREVVANPAKYPDDYRYGTPYKTTVSQATKDFINVVISRQE
ncbi:MAG: hypothetical protein WCT41_02100 [Candidatus Paceibacterota bacterium]|jgi:hypothetical protein